MLSAPIWTPAETKISVLVSVSVKRFGVSRMRDFFWQNLNIFFISLEGQNFTELYRVFYWRKITSLLAMPGKPWWMSGEMSVVLSYVVFSSQVRFL